MFAFAFAQVGDWFKKFPKRVLTNPSKYVVFPTNQDLTNISCDLASVARFPTLSAGYMFSRV